MERLQMVCYVSRMPELPTEKELYEAYNDFAGFTCSLVEEADSESKKWKFAVVTAQAAVELFLKWVFVKNGNTEEVLKKDKGSARSFRDFSQILANYFRSQSSPFGRIRDLNVLLEDRNAILHKGLTMRVHRELSRNVVGCLFFIHATGYHEFGELLFGNRNAPPGKGRSQAWQSGATEFAKFMHDEYDWDFVRCLDCGIRTVISGESLPLNDTHSETSISCLNCFGTLDTDYGVELLECYMCCRKSYVIDALNEQKGQQFVGKCTECDTATWVRRCAACERMYHPGNTAEVKSRGMFYCSPVCAM